MTFVSKPTTELPEIIWERGLFEEENYPNQIYSCSGESKDGRLWSGEWMELDGSGEVEIEGIEEN